MATAASGGIGVEVSEVAKTATANPSRDTAPVMTSAQLEAERSRQRREDATDPAPLRFDPQRRAASDELKGWLADFVGQLTNIERQQNPAKRARRTADAASFALAVEALVCNLIALDLVGANALSVQRGNDLLGGRSRYKSPVLGRGFKQAMDLMLNASSPYIEQPTLGYKYNGKASGAKGRGGSQPTTIKPTSELRSALSCMAVGWASLGHADICEVLVLKDAKDEYGTKARLEYVDTPATLAMRQQVERLNARLKSAPLELVATDDPALVRIDPGKRALIRVFNNASWEQGGRLFGGFWETMSKEQRFRHLRIAGQPVASADFGQLYLRLAYAHQGLQASLGDLYDATESGLERKAVKQLVNAMLSASKPLRGFPDDIEGNPPRASFKRARQAILAAHAPIADCFEAGLGHRFAFTESQILLDVLEALDALGITALPVHDCVLVPGPHAETAKRIMEQVFSRHCGGLQAVVSLDFAPGSSEGKLTAPL